MAFLDFDTYLNNVRTAVSNSATWQGITGTSTADLAAAHIYKGGYYEEELITPPICILSLGQWAGNWSGQRFNTGNVPVEMWFEIAIPAGSKGTYQDEYAYCMQKLAGICADVQGYVQDGGKLMSHVLAMEAQPGLVDEDENNGRRDWRFVLSLSGRVV